MNTYKHFFFVSIHMDASQKVENVIKKLEKEGEQKVAELLRQLSTGERNLTTNACLQIIREGGETFEQVTGRKMTYTEMRSMYG